MRRQKKQARAGRPTALTEVLQSVLEDAESSMDNGQARVQAAWTTVVGEDLARETRVVWFRRGVASIEVASPPLCSELSQFRAEKLLAAVRTILKDEPPVRELRFRLGAF